MPKNKKNNYKKILSIEDAPITKKEKKEPERLGIINKKNVSKHFFISSEDNEALKSLVHCAEKKLNFKMNDTKVFQILVRGALKNQGQFIKWIKKI